MIRRPPSPTLFPYTTLSRPPRRVARLGCDAPPAPPPSRAGGRGSCGGPDRSADPSHAVEAAHAAWNLLACELPPHSLHGEHGLKPWLAYSVPGRGRW